MMGYFTQFDGAEIITWAFFAFFGALIFWLRREDRREGYPVVEERPMGRPVRDFPQAPAPKTYTRLDGPPTQMPHHYGSSKALGERLLRFPGAPLVPLGNPMLAEIGPGAYPLREDVPLMSYGHPQVLPLRIARDWAVARGDTDPRGLTVYAARHVAVGTVTDLWVDRSVKILRYLEVALTLPEAAGRWVLLPIYYTDINARRQWVRVRSLLSFQFADVPGLASMDQITAREEDRLNAYYSSGQIFGRGNDGGLPLPRAATAASQ